MTHYFINDPNLKHNRKQIVFRFLGVDFVFESDAGVFSKNHVDPGTARMLQHIVDAQVHASFLDFGCGYGVVGCVIKAMFPQSNVVASDVNQRAIELTQKNATLNKVAITTILSDGFDSIDQSFETIGFNPPIKVGKVKMYDLMAQCHQHLTDDGILWLVIRKDQGAKSAMNYLVTLFKSVEVKEKYKGFWILSCKRS
jgi:16S rRNA (guanine1207-N2)-methyltransferase